MAVSETLQIERAAALQRDLTRTRSQHAEVQARLSTAQAQLLQSAKLALDKLSDEFDLLTKFTKVREETDRLSKRDEAKRKVDRVKIQNEAKRIVWLRAVPVGHKPARRRLDRPAAGVKRGQRSSLLLGR